MNELAELYGWIAYLVVAVIILIVGGFIYKDDIIKSNHDDAVAKVLCCAIAWPLILMLVASALLSMAMEKGFILLVRLLFRPQRKEKDDG